MMDILLPATVEWMVGRLDKSAPEGQTSMQNPTLPSLPLIIAGCAAFMIAACQVPQGPESSSYTTSGEDLGSDIPFQKIDAQSSKVAIEGGDPLVISYETRSLNDRIQEQIALDGGFMTATLMHPGYYLRSNVSSDDYLWQYYAPTLRDKGISLQSENINNVSYQNGDLSYISGTSASEECFAFVLTFWKRAPIDTLGQGDTGLRGGVCLPLDDPRAARLEQYMLDLLSRVRFL